jgi:hypothetical protein
MSEAEIGVGQHVPKLANGLRSRHEPPRVCRTVSVKNVEPNPGKHGGRHYAVSNAHARGSVTDGCQHATARCIVAAANAGVLRCTSQSVTGLSVCRG